jgi:anti-sigma B factor antagonist
MRLSIESRPDGAGTIRLALSGDADLAGVEDLNAAIAAAVAGAGTRSVVVDLGAVEFMDSSGIGCLIRGWHLADAAGVDYQVVNPSARILWVLEVSGVWIMLAGRDVRTDGDVLAGSDAGAAQ